MEQERKEAVHFPGGDATASSVPTAERPRTRPPNLPPWTRSSPMTSAWNALAPPSS